MRISYQPWGESLDELVDAGIRAEQAGATVLWAPELHRSATIVAAALAAATSTASIGTGIALAFTRSPMITALEALDLDELSGGRFVLGLGTGVQRLNEDWHNVAFGKAIPHMRETVRNLRAFWRDAGNGSVIDLPGAYEPMRIRGYRRPLRQQRERVPVYLAAMGPAMTRLAGEIADGWISHELCSPGYIAEVSLPELLRGLAKADRQRQQLQVVASLLCSIDDDPQLAVRRASGTVGFYASVRTYANFWAHHGFANEQTRIIESFRSGTAADDLGDLAPRDMITAVTASGTPDDVRARISEFADHVDCVKLSPPSHGLTVSEMRVCQDRIIGLIPTL